MFCDVSAGNWKVDAMWGSERHGDVSVMSKRRGWLQAPVSKENGPMSRFKLQGASDCLNLG